MGSGGGGVNPKNGLQGGHLKKIGKNGGHVKYYLYWIGGRGIKFSCFGGHATF